MIGNHSYSHSYNTIYVDEEAFWTDFNKCQKSIYDITGVYPNLFRFPGGSNTAINLNGQQFIEKINAQFVGDGIQFFDWNIDVGDARSNGVSVESIKNAAISQLYKKRKAVVLFHDTDAKSTTVEALPSIIEYYLDKGYRFDVLDADGFTVQF